MADTTAAPQTLTFDEPSQSSPTAAQPAAASGAPQTLQLDTPQTLQLDTADKDVNPPEQPGFVSRTMDTSGAEGLGKLAGQTAGYVGNMPAHVYNRVQGLEQAYSALKQGDLKKANMIAHTLLSGPDDPITAMAKDLIKVPFAEAIEAYKAFKVNSIANPDTDENLAAAQHGIRSIPLIGAGAEHVGSLIAEDLRNHNWSALSGDLVGIVPALTMGAESKAAKLASTSGAEGAAEAAADATSNAIRPSQRMIGRTSVPVTALQAENPSMAARALKTLANNPAGEQAQFAAQHTQPAAVNATVTSLEDVARNHIQTLRDHLGDNTPYEADMSTLRKQSGAMKDAAQEVYQKFDKASDEDQAAFKDQQVAKKEAYDKDQAEKKTAFEAEQKTKQEAFEKPEQSKTKASENTPAPHKAAKFKAEKFEPDEFEEDERPLTFREMQTRRGEAVQNMRAGTTPEAYKAAQNDLRSINKQMDDFADKHDDVVSPDEYKLANSTRHAAGQHDFIADRLKIDQGTDEIPASITKGSLKTLPQTFEKRYGDGSFEKYLGPEGFKNYNAVRDVLENPTQGQGLWHMAKVLTRHAASLSAGYAAGGGVAGAAALDAGQYAVGHIAENLLFNPEYGQTVLAAWRHAQNGMQVVRPVAAAAPLLNRNNGPTHVWTPDQGIVATQ
jgi:hypothetical protein